MLKTSKFSMNIFRYSSINTIKKAFCTRGFAKKEFENRLGKAQSLMHKHKMDGILLTSEANI